MYDREVQGRTLTFGVSGALYRNSLIMFDRETRTLWSHLLGAAVDGPLEGTRLRFVSASLTTWAAWLRDHPETLALSPERSPYAAYGDAYAGYFAGDATGILGTHRKDTRLGPKELVLGVLAPAAKAYAYRDLERLGKIRDTLAGRPVEVRWDAAGHSATAFILEGAKPRRLPSTPIFWFAWVDFFPRAPLWEPRPR